MRYAVKHATWYDYSRPVFIEPHVIRLSPRRDASLAVHSSELQINPEPAGLAEGLDAENNPFHQAWFNGLADRFEITSTFIVETLKENPFDSFLNTDDRLPLHLSPQEAAVLSPCLDAAGLFGPGDQKTVTELGERLKQESGGGILPFLNLLNGYLYKTVEKVLRQEPGIQSIGQTLGAMRGACRDTAVVFMAVCRSFGIPSRFVSGCQEGDPDLPEGELHAWAEIYLPGFGWRGFDPTHGLAVADRHIPYAASALPANTAPVQGSFRGTGAAAQLHHLIEMKPLMTCSDE